MIDYALLSKAISCYEGRGFQRIETPWLVSQNINSITTPVEASTFIVKKSDEKKEKAFVASGEQGFLYLIAKGYMPKSGKYQTVTPCLRNDAWSQTHCKQFMKLELIFYTTSRVDREYIRYELSGVLNAAKEFMQLNLRHDEKDRLAVVETGDDEFDILLNGVEVGSYGIRSCSFVTWVYGTGLAEPRFSRFLNSHI